MVGSGRLSPRRRNGAGGRRGAAAGGAHVVAPGASTSVPGRAGEQDEESGARRGGAPLAPAGRLGYGPRAAP